MRRILLVFAIVVGLCGLGSSAYAFPGLEDAVVEKYPNATNLGTCGTCHVSFKGNSNGRNPYGHAFGDAFPDNGFDPGATFTAIEGGDADGDGSANGEEMTTGAGFLPGFTCDTADTAVNAPADILDFVDPIDPGCDGIGTTTTLPPPTTTVPVSTTTLPVVTTTTVIVTTTTISGPTTTTLPGEPKCSQPVSSGDLPRASDCLYILRAAVEAVTCVPECVCDPNAQQGITAADALLCLRRAVEQPVELNCPCDGTTTTTTVIGPTTTSIPGTTTTVPATTTTIPTTTTTAGGGGNIEAGRVVYNNNCSSCHAAGSHDPVAEFGADLAGKGEDILAITGDIHPGLSLPEQEKLDIAAFLDSF